MIKPQPKTRRAAYDYHAVASYIEELTGKDLRNWKGHSYDKADKDPTNPPYCDFWHWVVDGGNVHNGSYFYLNVHPTGRYVGEGNEWVSEILDIIHREFPEADGELYCFVEW